VPEFHDCPEFNIEDTRVFNSSAPNIRDRRGTWGKKISRVRDKETKNWERKSDKEYISQTQSKHSTDENNKILNCPVCGGKTASLSEPSCCEEAMCEKCIESHECDHASGQDQDVHQQQQAKSWKDRMISRLSGLF